MFNKAYLSLPFAFSAICLHSAAYSRYFSGSCIARLNLVGAGKLREREQRFLSLRACERTVSWELQPGHAWRELAEKLEKE